MEAREDGTNAPAIAAGQLSPPETATADTVGGALAGTAANNLNSSIFPSFLQVIAATAGVVSVSWGWG